MPLFGPKTGTPDCWCSACGRGFEYSDEWSPSIKDDIWRQCCDFFGISKEEEAARTYRFNRLYDELKRKHKPLTITNRPEFHTMLCYKCMEEALGRPLTQDDMIAPNTPLNRDFETMVLTDQEHSGQ